MYDLMTLYPLEKVINIYKNSGGKVEGFVAKNVPAPLNNSPIIPVPDQSQKSSKISHYFRSIERGSVLVCSAQNRVVLQHPRGNLEAVYPKILLFFALKSWIAEGRYKDAYVEIRRHKLDMNLLVDIDQPKF